MKDVVKTNPNKNAPKRRRRRRNLSLYYLLMFLFVAAVLFILSRTVLFNIKQYNVSGNMRYSTDQILTAGNLKVGKNMYNLDLDKTEQAIKKTLIYVEDVTLKRDLPDTLHVIVTEAVEFACCEYEGNRYCVISRGGRYLETEQPYKREELMMVTGLDLKGVALGEDMDSHDENKLEIIFDLFDAIDKTCPDMITYIDITDRTNIKMGYNGRIDIDFGSSLDYEYKLRYITAIIEENLDPEAAGKIIYHSSAAGASFISAADLELQAQQNAAAVTENTAETSTSDPQ